MNYRTVMVFGKAALVNDAAARQTGFDTLVEQLAPGRLSELRESTAKELNATYLLSLPIETFTTKVRRKCVTPARLRGHYQSGGAGTSRR